MVMMILTIFTYFFFQAKDGIRDVAVTGVQTCALPILRSQLDAGKIFEQLAGFAARIDPGERVAGPVGTLAEKIIRRRVAVLCRSEERRVGKEWSSRSLP